MILVIYLNAFGVPRAEDRNFLGKIDSTNPEDFGLAKECRIIAVLQRASYERLIVNGKEVFNG